MIKTVRVIILEHNCDSKNLRYNKIFAHFGTSFYPPNTTKKSKTITKNKELLELYDTNIFLKFPNNLLVISRES